MFLNTDSNSLISEVVNYNLDFNIFHLPKQTNEHFYSG